MAPLLGYWDMRGVAEPIKCILYYTGTDFEEKRYQFGPTIPRVMENWYKYRDDVGLDFPNLPYYIDGDIKITQSLAILRHLGRKHGLYPATEEELCRLENVEQESHDLIWDLVRLSYGPDYEANKQIYMENLPGKLSRLSKFLGTKQWLLGDQLTYVDFHLHESLSFQVLFAPDCLDAFENLKKYVKRFEALPQIEKYMKSEKYKRWPVCGPSGKFGFRDEPPA